MNIKGKYKNAKIISILLAAIGLISLIYTQITQNKNIEQVQPSDEKQKETVTPQEPTEENNTVSMPEPKPEMNNVQENIPAEEPSADRKSVV